MADITIRTRDPRVDLTSGMKMEIQEGARTVKLNKRAATSVSNSGIQFDNIDPGNTGFVLDRKIYVNTTYVFRLIPRTIPGLLVKLQAGTNAEFIAQLNNLISAIGYGINFGPRAFPLSQATSHVEFVINNETFGYDLNNYWDVMARYDTDAYNPSCTDYSLTPSMQDIYHNYDLRDLVVNGGFELSPFLSYGQNNSRTPRGAFIPPKPTFVAGDAVIADLNVSKGGLTLNFSAVDGNNDKTLNYVEFSMEITEPLVIPLLAESMGRDYDVRGLYGVNDFKVTINYDANLPDRLLAGAPTTVQILSNNPGLQLVADLGPTVFDAGQTNNTNIYYNVLTPKYLPELPNSNVYSDARFRQYSQDAVTLNIANDTAIKSMSTNSFSVGSVPSRIYFWIQKEQVSQRIGDANAYAYIEGFDFNFNEQNTQFSGADPEQLYLMCRRNGLTMDWLQFSQKIGSPMCIDFARDVSLFDGDYPGRIGKYNFNMNIDFRVLSNAVGDRYRLYVLTVLKGYCVIQNQICNRTTGLVQVDPNNIPLSHPTGYEYMMMQNVYGGAFKDTLKKYGHKALQYGKKAIDFGKSAAPYVEKALPYVEKGIEMALPLLAAGAGISEMEAKGILAEYGPDEGIKVLKKMQKQGGMQPVGAGKKPRKKTIKAKAGAKASKAGMKASLY